ncbi:hypothetical protein C8Q80DRAFT_191965 [Daedaleopsis nitida]|nr:hypothetical protein C8Q80DRAFT_191965 [Daedaleopsis nitida]
MRDEFSGTVTGRNRSRPRVWTRTCAGNSERSVRSSPQNLPAGSPSERSSGEGTISSADHVRSQRARAFRRTCQASIRFSQESERHRCTLAFNRAAKTKRIWPLPNGVRLDLRISVRPSCRCGRAWQDEFGDRAGRWEVAGSLGRMQGSSLVSKSDLGKSNPSTCLMGPYVFRQKKTRREHEQTGMSIQLRAGHPWELEPAHAQAPAILTASLFPRLPLPVSSPWAGHRLKRVWPGRQSAAV